MGVSLPWRTIAFVWGFIEATIFFTVPDVLLTFAAIKLGWRKAMRLIVCTLIGALLGGGAMYGLAVHNFETARATVDSVPLIPNSMISRVIAEMQGNWLWEMFEGSVTGTPYKVFAIAAPGSGIPLWMFLLGSAAVRPIRWALVLTFAAIVASMLRRAGYARLAVPLCALLWIVFYAFYYVVMAM